MKKFSKKELANARKNLRIKAERRNTFLRERLVNARNDFEAITKMIIKKYNPLKIYQWGSLVHHEHFSEISDIDIAVEGLKSVKDYFSLLKDADKMTSFPIDIIQIEDIHPLHARSIRERGRIVYEKK